MFLLPLQQIEAVDVAVPIGIAFRASRSRGVAGFPDVQVVAIHRAAGPRLLAQCGSLGGCKTGDAKITGAYDLPAKFVIHTVGPVWQGGQSGEAALLESCYRRCFHLALEHGVDSIAFPAVSTGVFGYPRVEAATLARSVMGEFDGRFEAIIACCFSEQDGSIYRDLTKGQMGN